jgi:hypothetical protein
MALSGQQQEQFNSQFASDVADLRLRLQLITDAINAMDTAMRGTFDLLIDQGMLPEDAAGLRQYDKAMAVIRKAGLRTERPKPGTGVKCPGCQSVLQVKGVKGDRCDWCGYQF